MKKLLFAALIAGCLINSAFATDENKISSAIRSTFKEEFKGVDGVEWTMRQDFVKVTFTQNNQQVEAFYDYNGNNLGHSNHVALEDLPLIAKRTIAKKYPEHSITEAVVFYGPGEESFYVSAENKEEKVVLKITKEGYVSTFKKTRKDKFW